MSAARDALGRLLRRARFWVWCALGLGLGLALGLVPLFGVLGYECALACALVAAVCGLDLGAALARELGRMPPLRLAARPGRALAASTGTAAALAVAVIAIPGVVCAVRGIWVPTCDWWFGLEAYAIMPLASAALGAALGHALAVAVGVRADRRWRPHRSTWLAVVAPLVVLVAAAAWRFYSEPPVFVYSPVIGYFPGNLYDENVRLGAPLYWERLEDVLAVIAIVAAVASRLDVPSYRVRLREPRPGSVRRIGALVTALACAAGAIALHLDGAALGYAIDAGDIADELGGRIETPHFVIHYAHTPEIDADIALIAEDHEFRYAEVVAQLGAAPAGKLTSYYFASADQKARWMGARGVEMAKPWRHEIYLDHREFPHPSLRHEIAHAVASAFGDPIFGLAARRVLGVPALISPGLVEGLAVAIDWPATDSGLTPHEAVRALDLLGYQPPLRELLSVQFLTVSSARGYTTAGSFVRFLLDRYGAAKLRALYGSGDDFAGVYGKSLDELTAEWRRMIDSIQLSPGVVESVKERFRAGSVFARPCPHAIAARREQALHALAAGDRTRAVSLLREVCSEAPEEPRHTLELADFLATGDTSERAEATALWTELAGAGDAITTSVRAEALQRLARAAAARGDLAGTGALLDRAARLPVDSDARRQVEAEQLALHATGPAGPALRGYFFTQGPSPLDGAGWALLASYAQPELGFTHYLLGIQAGNQGKWPLAAAELDRALALGVPGIEFVKNGARKLAIAAYRAGDTVLVGRAIALLSGPDTSATDRLLGADWSARLVFDATGRL
ncbi:MAG TPA: hypothetical protein VLX92_08275 [Kofleriaceae bacterium]|nr:hypothetical protein [Kofleriaceae bacterium]